MPTIDVLLGAFGAGIYAIVAVTHLDLWNRRRGNHGHLWLALASASALVVDVTGVAAAFVGEAAGAPLAALNLLGVAAATVSLLELAGSFSGAATPGWFRGQQIATLIMAPAGALRPGLLTPVLASCAVLILAAVIRAATAARQQADSRQVARGFVVLAVCLLADLAKELTRVPIPNNLPLLGFTVLFLAAARSLNEQFEREHDASRRDTLTGMPNRRRLLEAWHETVARADRSGGPVSIVLADVDHFKRINDSRGHAVGDATLVAVAALVRRLVRAQDSVARWGGDELLLLLPDTDAVGAAHLAEEIRGATVRLHTGPAAEHVEASLSMGVAQRTPGESLDALLARADSALYNAKAAGRNRVVVAS